MESISKTLSSLSKEIKPLLEKLEKEVHKENIKISKIAGKGIGVSKAKQFLNLEKDFQGIYVFIESKKPIYVGISRSALIRIQGHVKNPSHFSASLAYKMADNETKIEGSRSENMDNPKFKEAFLKAQERILNCDFAFLEVKDDNLLYLLEFVSAKHFNTLEYNSFRTH